MSVVRVACNVAYSKKYSKILLNAIRMRCRKILPHMGRISITIYLPFSKPLWGQKPLSHAPGGDHSYLSQVCSGMFFALAAPNYIRCIRKVEQVLSLCSTYMYLFPIPYV